MISISVVTVIGLALAIIYGVMQWWAGVTNDRKKEISDVDKQIDDATGVADFIDIDDKLHS